MLPKLRLYLMALAAVTLWGASFPLTKAALDYVGPTSLAFLRWAISAIALIGWLVWRKRTIPSRTEPPSTLSGAERSRRAGDGVQSNALRAAIAQGCPFDSGPRTDAALRSGCLPRLHMIRGPKDPDNPTQDAGVSPGQDDTLALIGRLLRQDWRAVIWVALTGITLFYWLENTALRYTTAINAGVLSNLTAIFMTLIAIVTLGERLRALEWAAMAAAFGGAVLVSRGAGHLALNDAGMFGDLLMVVACLFAAIYSIGGKRLAEKYPAVVVTTVVATIGALFLLPLALLEGLHLDLPLAAWGILLLLGLGAGALANVWWLTILARMAASRAALALFLIPVISAALAVLLLNEPLTLTIALGSALVLGGVMVVQGSGQGKA